MRHSGKKYFLCCVILILACSQVFAQQQKLSGSSAKATADSAAIKIGEQFYLHLKVNADKDLPLIWPAVPDSFNHFLVVEKGPIDTVDQQGTLLYQQKILLTSFDSGNWEIPSFSFRVKSGDTTIAPPTLITDSLAVLVNTIPVDTAKPFEPIKQIRSVPFNILAYWPYLLGSLIILLLLVYFIFIKKKKIKLIPEKVIAQEPPYEQAMKSLQLLEKEKLWQHNEVKIYYTRLTDILRIYIERRFQVNAMEQTSDELLKRIKPVTKLNQQHDNLRYILHTADLAKFAKLQPLPEEHERSMQKAYEIVEWTKPKPEDEQKEVKAVKE